MAITPLWKIKRELNRVIWQSISFPSELAKKIYFRRFYDLFWSKAVKITIGGLPFETEVAIYLIFPINGLLDSHRYVIEEMGRSGVTPVVVSNFPLSDADRHKMLEKVGLLIERPNIGYDFGGYRDAILALSDRFGQLDRLYILNDSTWMIPQQENWFESTRKLDFDFVGATSHHGLERKDLMDYSSIEWNFDNKRRRFHYASYAWSIGPAILREPDFVDFWRKLDIRNEKNQMVRRGEIGFSQWVLRKGYTHGATWEIDELDKELEALTDEEVDVIARDVILREDKRLYATKTDVIENGSRVEKIGFILATVSRQAGSYALPVYGLRWKNFHFLKKGALTTDQAAETRKRAIAQMPIKPPYDIEAEVSLLQMN